MFKNTSKIKSKLKSKINYNTKKKYSKKNTKKYNKNLGKKTSHPASKYFIISECYNQKYNYLLTTTLKKFFSEYNLIEYPDIRNYDLKLLRQKKLNINNDKNCYNLVKLIKRSKLPEYITNKKYEFIWINQIEKNTDRRINMLRTKYKNLINDQKISSIYNKSTLYKNIILECKKIANQHLALTFAIDDYSKYKFDSVQHYILRPVNSYEGKDIIYISSRKELDNAIKYYNTTKNYNGNIYGNNVIASKYIINPLLFRGYKFHLRMYYLISYIDNIFNSFFLEEGDILTAEKPYTIHKPFLKEVHDTHQTSSNNDYFFPKDLISENGISSNDVKNYIRQMREIMKCVSRIIKKDNSKWLYPEQDNGFIIMGADFMIDTTGNVILLEVNFKPGFGYNKRKNDIEFSNHFFNWINAIILEPIYKYKNQYISRQHKTYLDIN
jgi:hypothetical protein